MVTAIVRKVQALLRAAGRSDVAVEIVFPVASEAITTPVNQGAWQFIYNLSPLAESRKAR